jgi:hypothetical protein
MRIGQAKVGKMFIGESLFSADDFFEINYRQLIP